MRNMFEVPFIDRERELEALNRLRGLGIIYGRRRTGKTRLLLEWLKERGLFWEAFVGSYEELGKSFAETAKRELNIYLPMTSLRRWRGLTNTKSQWPSTNFSTSWSPTPQ